MKYLFTLKSGVQRRFEIVDLCINGAIGEAPWITYARCVPEIKLIDMSEVALIEEEP